MIEDVFGFDDLGRKVKIGEYEIPDPVGGRIFYINSSSDEIVEFYDSNGNVISNVVVGDTPAYYKVISQGTSGKDKYYVYREELYDNKVWTYYENNDWVYENTWFQSNNIGAGKSNTNGIMALHEGAYITDDASGYETVWYAVQQFRSTNLGGCSDWFISTGDELSALREFINANKSTLGLIDLITDNNIWTSSEYNYNLAKCKYNSALNSDNKSNPYKIIPIRSF